MRSRSVDRILLLIGVLLMLVSSYQLFFHKEFFSQNKVLGELSNTLSVVKIKHALNLDWRDARIGHDISENQLVFTNPAASAEITFHEGGKLQIGENSLIKITSKGKETGLNIERGIIRARLDSEKPFLLEMNGKEFQLTGDGTEIQINLNDKKGEIGVISGNLTVEKEGDKETISPDSLLAINEGKIQKKEVPFKLLSPIRDSVFHSLEQFFPVTFNWSPGEEVEVLLSDSPQMENSRNLSARPGLSLDLTPGTYYWRVKTDKGPSIINSFKIIMEIPPAITRPLDGEEILILAKNEESSDLVLQWQGEPRISHKVEWETADGFESRVVHGSSAIVKVKGSGRISWRVRIEDEKRPLALWSSWQNIEVTRVTLPETPSNLIPDGIEYQTYSNNVENVDLSWSSNHQAELELLSPTNDRELLNLKEKSYSVEAKESGVYRWRIRAIDAYARVSSWSDWKTFEITDMSEESNKSVQRIQLKRPDQLVKFNWENDDNETTTFELSKDTSFNEIVITRHLKSASTETVVPSIGTYYWRSRQLNSDGTFTMKKPVKVIIETAPAPTKPDKLPDVEVPIEWRVIEKSSSWNFLDFFISSAYADEVKGVVQVELPKDENAKSILVRVYADPEKKELVLEKNITDSNFEWVGAKPGNYYWQYALVDYWNRRSPFSDLAQLTVTGKEVKMAGKPKLFTPIRAVEVEGRNLTFKWSKAIGSDSYQLQISGDRNFNEILLEKKTKKNRQKIKSFPFDPGLYYWRVKALNEVKQETLSNTGRFIVKPPLERIIIADQFPEWKKDWKTRASVSWTPSMDDYSFTDGASSGKIDGRAIMGIEIKGTRFYDKWIMNGEILRQSGEVFEGQGYLFQRLFVDSLRNFSLESGTRLGAGLAIGHTTGQEYTIEQGAVRSTATSDVSYGPVLRSYHPISQKWEAQTKLLYFLGSIKQIEISADIIKAWKGNYHFIGGLSYASREYEIGAGKQSSTRVSMGIGRDF